MKKVLTLVLAMLMMLAFTTVAFAEETTPPAVKGEYTAIKAEIQVLRDQLNGLREQHKTIHAQAVEKHATIKSLFKVAKEASLTEKIQAAKAFGVQLKAISGEIKIIREDKKALWVQLKAAKTQKDYETVKANLTQIIEYKKQIIDKATSRLSIMDNIISTLQ